MSHHLTSLLSWYSLLTSTSVKQIDQFYQEDAYFKDPFNDVRGTAAIQAIFNHMFATTSQPHFVVLQSMSHEKQAFVTWIFHFSLKSKSYAIHGVSHLLFGDDGRVNIHRDYWDSSEELLQKLPLIGNPLRWLRNRFTAIKSHG